MLLVAGFVMLFIPGQGVLTMFIGLMLMRTFRANGGWNCGWLEVLGYDDAASIGLADVPDVRPAAAAGVNCRMCGCFGL
ncbi:MAG: PGPGW domain-containing protein [Spirochaetia bacterium]|nr:PGPGW domain-containing protein [Spirochaetia bacterium]